jgi:hypothetical protein
MKGSLGTRLLAVPFLLALALWLAVAGVGSHSASAAVTNNGFESGNLTGWTTGTVTEGVTVVGDDTITDGVVAEPLEGQYMARLGPSPRTSRLSRWGPTSSTRLHHQRKQASLRLQHPTYDYTGPTSLLRSG